MCLKSNAPISRSIRVYTHYCLKKATILCYLGNPCNQIAQIRVQRIPLCWSQAGHHLCLCLFPGGQFDLHQLLPRDAWCFFLHIRSIYTYMTFVKPRYTSLFKAPLLDEAKSAGATGSPAPADQAGQGVQPDRSPQSWREGPNGAIAGDGWVRRKSRRACPR